MRSEGDGVGWGGVGVCACPALVATLRQAKRQSLKPSRERHSPAEPPSPAGASPPPAAPWTVVSPLPTPFRAPRCGARRRDPGVRRTKSWSWGSSHHCSHHYSFQVPTRGSCREPEDRRHPRLHPRASKGKTTQTHDPTKYAHIRRAHTPCPTTRSPCPPCRMHVVCRDSLPTIFPVQRKCSSGRCHRNFQNRQIQKINNSGLAQNSKTLTAW